MDGNDIKVSVVIPAYNEEKYIGACLASIQRQTLEEIEVLVVNDGSTDHTADIVAGFQDQSPLRLRLFTRKNAGQGAARNFGLTQAQGKYLAFVDSDDYVDADYLKNLYETAERYGSDVVTSGYRSVLPDGRVLQTANVSPLRPVTHYGRPGTTCAKLFLREFLIANGFRYPEGGKIYEDVPFSIVTRFCGKNVRAISYVGYNYVRHAGSTMTGTRIHSERFPFKEFEVAVRQSLRAHADLDRLEYEIMYFFAGFFFLYCKKARKADIQRMCAFANHILGKYFRKYWKNPYLKPGRVKEVPFAHRFAVAIFAVAARLGLLFPVVYLISRMDLERIEA